MPILPGDPVYAMLAKAAQDLKAVNQKAGEGIERALAGRRMNRGVGEDADRVGGATLSDGQRGVEGDRINISEGYLNGGGATDSSDSSTWSGSCWNQLLGVLAHEWVHADSDLAPPNDQSTNALADYIREKPAFEKEMEVLRALGEPTGFYPYYVAIGGHIYGIPIKTRHEYLKQKLEEMRRKANGLLGLISGVLPDAGTYTTARGGFFDGVLGSSQQPTLIQWAVDGGILWGMTATTDGGSRYLLDMTDTFDVRVVPGLPLGSEDAVAFIAGSDGENGVILGLELRGYQVVLQRLRLEVPGSVPESISYRASDHSLWILDAAQQSIWSISDTDADGIPDTPAARPYAEAAAWPAIAESHEITARFDPPAIGIAPTGFLPVDMVPVRRPLTFLLDDDQDGVADRATESSYGAFVSFPPSITDRPVAGAVTCEVFGAAGAQVTLGTCDAAGSFTGLVLGVGTVPAGSTLELPLARALAVGEYVCLYDPVNDPDGEATVYQVPPEGTNRPPVPVVAELQIVTQMTPTGAMVTLDASASHDPDADPLTITWYEILDSYSEADLLGTGPAITVGLPQGVHSVRVTLTDGAEEVRTHVGVGVAPPPVTFPDVLSTGFGPDGTDTFWAFWEIEAIYTAGITLGYGDGTYGPGDPVTRAQMATYVSRAMAGGDAYVPTGSATATFDDVPVGSWAYDYVEYAYANGVVKGFTETEYRPDELVNRGQMAAFIARAIATPTGEAGLVDYTPPATPTFSDVTPDNDWSWCYLYVEYIEDQGVVLGYGGDDYRPAEWVTRDQMAVYLRRAFALPIGLGG